jgi:hypothetical protein
MEAGRLVLIHVAQKQLTALNVTGRLRIRIREVRLKGAGNGAQPSLGSAGRSRPSEPEAARSTFRVVPGLLTLIQVVTSAD